MRRLTADLEVLAFLDGLDGAVVSASAAADTDISVDDVLVIALRDSLNGALVGTGATLDTSIGDIVSHDYPSNMCFGAYMLCTSILAWIFKNAIPFFERAVYFLHTGAKILG